MVPASECKRIDKGRHADANFAAKQQNITFGTDRQGNERLIVPYTDYLCTDHMPVLPAKQILGAPVLIQTEAEGMLPAIVVEPAPLPTAGRGGQGELSRSATTVLLSSVDTRVSTTRDCCFTTVNRESRDRVTVSSNH